MNKKQFEAYKINEKKAGMLQLRIFKTHYQPNLLHWNLNLCKRHINSNKLGRKQSLHLFTYISYAMTHVSALKIGIGAYNKFRKQACY